MGGRRVCTLLVENMATREFEGCPGQVYLNRDTLESLYQVFNVQVRPTACLAGASLQNTGKQITVWCWLHSYGS